MKNTLCLLSFLLIVLLPSAFAQRIPKVLIIGIDGCRPDALQAAATPHIDQLIANATYSYDALTEAPTWSGVGWSGMLTGVWRDKHGVSDNSFSGSNYGMYPHFFNRLGECNANLVRASIVHWGPINSQIVDQVEYGRIVATDLAVQQEAVAYLGSADPDVLFLHFDDVDGVGHRYGFDPAVAEYRAVISLTDTYVGDIMAAVQNRPSYSNENWLVILSTDHGGNLTGHGGSSIEERLIFNIFSGDDLPNEQRSRIEQTAQINTALSLNATDQYIDVPDHPSYHFGANGDFSIECRVRIDNIAGDPVIVSNKDWVSGFNAGYVLSFPANGPAWKVNIGDGSRRVDINGGAIDDGNWHHLAVTFDRDGMMTVYEDGSLIRAEDISTIGNINSGLPFAIGQDGTHTYTDWFDGEISEVRLWNSVLSAETIRAHACSAVSGDHPDFGSLIGYWTIDSGSGTSIFDKSPAANHGTLRGASPVWTTATGELSCQDYSQSTRIVDVAATALEYLCGFIDPNWLLDGSPVPFNTPLPVEWAEFKGESGDCKVLLEWTTSSEIDHEHTTVERSENGRDFIPLAKLPGRGRATGPTHYQYTDRHPLSTAYYRLRQQDLDGSIHLSDIIVVKNDPCSRDGLGLEVLPNPAGDQVDLRYAGTFRGGTESLVLTDLLGRAIASWKGEDIRGLQRLQLDISGLSPGVYFILLKDGQQSLASVKFVKK